MGTEDALQFIRATLQFKAILYFEAHLESPATTAAVAEALVDDDCTVVAFPDECLLKITARHAKPKPKPWAEPLV